MRSKMSGKKRFFLRAAALFVLMTFFSRDCFLYAVPAVNIHSPELHFKIPVELGRVEYFYQGTNGKTILFIQDAHESLDAQENIAALIANFVANNHVQTVFEEGYEGPVPTDKYFSRIQENQVKQKTAYFLLDRLRLGGAEYAHINRRRDFKLIGVDSSQLQMENIFWYRKMKHDADGVLQDLEAIRRELFLLAQKYFSEDMKEWMKLKKRLSLGEIDLHEYLKRLKTLSVKYTGQENFDQKYPVIRKIFAADSPQAPDSEQIMNAEESKIFFVQLSELEKSFLNICLQNSRDKMIYKYYSDAELLQRLARMELSSSESVDSEQLLSELHTQEILDFIDKLSGKSIVLSKAWEEYVQKSLNFYATAHLRDGVVENHLRHFALTSGENTAVLVFGGFHKTGIEELLKRNHFSYAVITPRIEQLSTRHEAYYETLMTKGLFSYEHPVNATRAETALQRWDRMDIHQAAVEIETIAEAVRKNIDLDPLLLNAQIEKELGDPESYDVQFGRPLTRQEQRSQFLLEDIDFHLSDILPPGAVIKRIIGIYDNTNTLTPSFEIPLTAEMQTVLAELTSVPGNATVINSGDPYIGLIGDPAQQLMGVHSGLIHDLKSSNSLEQLHFVTDSGKYRFGYKPDGNIAYWHEVEDWPVADRIKYAHILARSFFDELSSRLKNNPEDLPPQLAGLTVAELELERKRVHRLINDKGRSSEHWTFIPDGENKNLIAYIFKERFDEHAYIYDSGSKMAIVTTGLEKTQQFESGFYRSLESRVLKSFKTPPFKTFWGSGYLDITETSKVEGVLASFEEGVLSKESLEENEYVLLVPMGDSGNDLPTLSHSFSEIKKGAVLPVFLSHDRDYASLVPSKAIVSGDELVGGGLEVLNYLREIQGKQVRDTPTLKAKRWVKTSDWQKRMRLSFESEREKLFAENLPIESEMQALVDLTQKYIRLIYRQGLQPGLYPQAAGKVALTATGSFGRGEMSRASDADGIIIVSDFEGIDGFLNFLTQSIQSVFKEKFPWVILKQDQLILPLDTDDDQRRAALIKTLTEAIDMRFITGNQSIFSQTMLLTRQQIEKHSKVWVKDVARHWNERYQKLGRMEGLHQREPDIKEGLGGLREFHSSRWIARLYTQNENDPLAELVSRKLITANELLTAQKNLQRLLTFRNALHRVSGGTEDKRILLRYQEDVARELGYSETRFGENEVSAVENMLSEYYEITRSIFLFSFRVIQQVVGRVEPVNEKIIETGSTAEELAVKEISGWFFRIEKGLEIIPENAPERFVTLKDRGIISAEILFKLFEDAVSENLQIDSRLLNTLKEHPPQITQTFKSADEAEREQRNRFFRFINQQKSIAYSLWNMKFMGFLSFIFPSFHLIEAHAVHDIEHRYTLDIEQMKQVDLLDKLLLLESNDPEIQQLQQLLSASLEWVRKNRYEGAIRFALLTEPIFKKFPDNWYQVVSDFDWPGGQFETVEWLLKNKDILITALRQGDFKDKKQFIHDKLNGRENLWHPLLLMTMLEVHLLQPDRKWLYQKKIEAAIVEPVTVRALSEAKDDSVVTLRALEVQGRRFQNIAEVMIHQQHEKDEVGRLALMTGVLAANNLSIMTAEINTEDQSGNLLDYFIVRDNQFTPSEFKPEHPSWNSLEKIIREDLGRVLKGEEAVEDLFIKRKGKSGVISSRPATHFKMRTKIKFRPSENNRTRLFLETANRPAALYVVTRVLAEEGVNILKSTIDTVGYDNTIGKKVVDAFTLQFKGRALPKRVQRRIERRLTSLLDKQVITIADLKRSEMRSEPGSKDSDITQHDLYPLLKAVDARISEVLDPGAYYEVINTLRDFMTFQSPFTFRHPKAMLHLIELVFSPYVDERLAEAIMDFQATHGLVGDNLNIPELKQIGSVQSYYLIHRLMQSGYEVEALSIKTKVNGYAAQPDALVYHPERQQTFLVEVKDYKKLGDVFKQKNNYQMEKYLRTVLTGGEMDMYPEELFSRVPDGIILVIGTKSEEFNRESIQAWYRERVRVMREKLVEEGAAIRPEFKENDPDFILKIFDKPVLYTDNEEAAQTLERPNELYSLHPEKWNLLKPVLDELLKDPAFKQVGPFNQNLFSYYARVLGDVSGQSDLWLYKNYLALAPSVEERMRIMNDPAQDAFARRHFFYRSEQRSADQPYGLNLTEYVKAFMHFKPIFYWGLTRKKRVHYNFDPAHPVRVNAVLTADVFNGIYGEILDNALDQSRTDRVDVSIIERRGRQGHEEAVLAVTNKGQIDFEALRKKAEQNLPYLAYNEEGMIMDTRRISYDGDLRPLSSDDLNYLDDTDLLFISGLSTKLSNSIKNILLFWFPLSATFGGLYFGSLWGFLAWLPVWVAHAFDLLPVGGFGMGMAQIKRLTDLAGGKLEIISENGITTFAVIFPMAKTERHEQRVQNKDEAGLTLENYYSLLDAEKQLLEKQKTAVRRILLERENVSAFIRAEGMTPHYFYEEFFAWYQYKPKLKQRIIQEFKTAEDLLLVLETHRQYPFLSDGEAAKISAGIKRLQNKQAKNTAERAENEPRSEQRRIAAPDQLFESVYAARSVLQKAADSGHTYFFNYQDVVLGDGRLNEAFFKLAYHVQNQPVKLIVFNADQTNEHLSGLRALGVQIAAEDFEETFQSRKNVSPRNKNILVTRDKNAFAGAVEYLKANEIRPYIETSEVSFFAALLFGLTDETYAGLFVRDPDGFYTASQTLQDQFALYQQSLLVAIAA